MKKLFLILLTVCTLVGCVKEGDETQKNIEITSGNTIQEVFADNIQGKDGVTFTTTGAWTSSIEERTIVKSTKSRTPDWISIDPVSGDNAGSYIINITFKPNYTGVKRTATINIRCNGTTISIIVSQDGKTKDGEIPEELPSTKTITINGVAFDFVLVKAGTFQMGGREDFFNERRHWVKLTKDYYIGKNEVTQLQWQTIMGGNPSYFLYNPTIGEKQNLRPVERVSWDDICIGKKSFLAKINAKGVATFTLPTEAQWEYAARGGHKMTTPEYMKYAGTDSQSELTTYAWYSSHGGGDAGDKTHEVGKKTANILGLYDMSGNVSEWCRDAWAGDNYPDTTTQTNPDIDPYIDPDVTKRDNRICRGGSWYGFSNFCRSASRSFHYLFDESDGLGFRLVILVP